MLFVELDLHSVVEFYLGAACISFDLYDLVVGIVVGDVLGDRCRDDSGRNGAVLAIDVGPLALAVELDLVAVFERDFIALPGPEDTGSGQYHLRRETSPPKQRTD